MARQSHIDQIGNVYIQQIDGSLPGKIPFEFNPQIQESGRGAKFQAISVLSRLGDLQAYTGTESLTINLSTQYIATAANNSEAEIELDGWMTGFTLVDIQKYELLYRSLTLPDFPDEGSIEAGYQYSRPPTVKIVMGQPQEPSIGNTPFANLLTYPRQVINNKLSNQPKYRNYKTFITSNVTINKNLEEMPVFLDDDGYILDAIGYDVSLTLIEVTPSYSDILPTFSDFFRAGSYGGGSGLGGLGNPSGL